MVFWRSRPWTKIWLSIISGVKPSWMIVRFQMISWLPISNTSVPAGELMAQVLTGEEVKSLGAPR